MLSSVQLSRLRSLLLVVFSLTILLWSSVASAAGRVEWKSKEFKEREGGSWRLELAIFMPSAPDVAHVPMKFEFQPIAYYERSMVDGDKLVERTVPLEHRQSLIESVEVGFLDSGSGKIEKRTRFTFKVTRAHGYEAGEYKVTIRDGRNGNTVGTPTTLKFQGENEIIDRRAMVFTGGGKKKDKKESGDSKEGGSDSEKAADESANKEEAPSDEGSAAEEPPADEGGESNDADGPPPIEEKPGGCGCRIESTSAPQQNAALVALMLGLGLAVRRRVGRRQSATN